MKTFVPISAEPTHDEIARLAYYFFEEGGRQHGHDVEHWLQAQAHLCTDSSRVAVTAQNLKQSNGPEKMILSKRSRQKDGGKAGVTLAGAQPGGTSYERRVHHHYGQ